METIVTPPPCNFSTLAPYVPTGPNPWNVTKVQHVYRRLGFGASSADVDIALALTPDQFIDSLVDGAFAMPLTPTPPWGYWAFSDYTDYETENSQFIVDWRKVVGNNFITENLRGRLCDFWLNHFVTELEVYFYAPYLFQYYNTIETHCAGNFQDLARAIGINSTMLIYLNGFQNTENNPNENYARELYELFSLGEGNNYTEDDITETARALTGYNHWTEFGAQITFDVSTHDTGNKTIFGQTDTFDYNGVIDNLFAERGNEMAFYICKKLYQYFVSPEIDAMLEADIIQPLADTFIANNFELVPVLKQLFKSEHFFDERALGVVIKSPFDVIFNFLNETTFFYNDDLVDAFLYYAGLMGQEIFDPPDVSGWQRDEDWINTSTLTGRWELMQIYVDYLFNNGLELTLTDLFKDLTNNSNDPALITQIVIDHFVSKQLHTLADYDIATDIFKWEVPQNYYDNGTWNLDWPDAPYQVTLLLKHIARMPEFQLK